MPVHYINVDGNLIPEEVSFIQVENRGFRYGDGVFETMLWENGGMRFLKYHLDRLRESLQIIKIEDYARFDLYFVRTKTEELIRKNNLIGKSVRVRLIVYRAGGGLYGPEANKSSFVLQVSPIKQEPVDKKVGLIVGLYTEYKKPFSDLSKLKSLNSLIYVMAGWFKNKFSYDDVLLVNQEGNLCESLTSNVFVYYEKTLYTPAISEGCIAGVMRRVVIELAEKEGIEVVEAEISPAIMNEADEIFCTNAVQGIQWVMGYKQKRYFNRISRILQERLKEYTLS